MLRGDAAVKKILTWIVAAVSLLAVASFFVAPYLARVGYGLRSGSEKYAREWKARLLACHSLDEVKQHFNCFVIESRPEGSVQMVRVTETVKGRPSALLTSFPDGRWIACAHADSHSEPGGGTIVSRDSSGEVHVFSGHVCGHVTVRGETLEEFYARLRGYNDVKEVFLR
jgi:hypothetical protein